MPFVVLQVYQTVQSIWFFKKLFEKPKKIKVGRKKGIRNISRKRR